MRSALVLLVPLVASACGGSSAAPTTTPAPVIAEPAPAPVIEPAPTEPAPTEPAPPPAPRPLPTYGAKEGFVIAEAPHGTVTMRRLAGKITDDLADGTVVSLEAPVEMGGGDVVQIKVDGKAGEIPSGALVTLLQRSPDGRYGVSNDVVSCGDMCHTTIIVFDGLDHRLVIGDGEPDTLATAWRADGGQLAIGQFGTVTLVDLAALAIAPGAGEHLFGPVYAPTGALFATDSTGAIVLVAGEKRTVACKAKSARKPHGGDMNSEGVMSPLREPPVIVLGTDGKPKC